MLRNLIAHDKNCNNECLKYENRKVKKRKNTDEMHIMSINSLARQLKIEIFYLYYSRTTVPKELHGMQVGSRCYIVYSFPGETSIQTSLNK